MAHPFTALEGDYLACLARCKVTENVEAASVAKRLIKDVDSYKSVEQVTGVPAAVIMALNERESSGNLNTYLGNGDSLHRPTVHVPKNRGPFKTWEAGAIDALHLDGLDRVKAMLGGWSWPRTLYESELYNGFGPRNHGRHSGYLWAGTNIYTGGKYVSDGVWSATTWDQQLGVVPVILALIERDSSLTFDKAVKPVDKPAPTVITVPPVGLGGSTHNIVWIQETLNKLQQSDLVIDGSYGRRTKNAIVAFQKAHPPLVVDGLAGPKTLAALETAEAA